MFTPDRYPSRRGKGDLGLHFQEGSSRFPEACKRERERKKEGKKERKMERKTAVGRWIAGGSIVFPPFSPLPLPAVASYKNIHARASRTRAGDVRSALLPISACCRRRVEVKEPRMGHGDISVDEASAAFPRNYGPPSIRRYSKSPAGQVLS